ncbi:MAG: glycoside hydrolase family 13 protein [Oscillospiraceae bacterium]|nr:glycoside hydrolase family 13 protein [Oscillospiraceae bacterium]
MQQTDQCARALNREALFSDETEDFRIPVEPDPGDEVTLLLRTGRDNAAAVTAVVDGTALPMEKYRAEGRFDYYRVRVTCGENTVSYHFEVTGWADSAAYDRLGCVSLEEYQHDRVREFSFRPGFHVPAWVKGAVCYQIYVDRFRNGDERNDVQDGEYYYTGGPSVRVTDWDKYPDTLDVRCFYGGDLQGVEEKLDMLQALGVEVIYFNPLFVSPSNHKYDTQDYDHIDPHFAIIEEDTEDALPEGETRNSLARRYIARVTSAVNLDKSDAYFAELVRRIHSRGMRVIIDGVFNHCGSFHKWMDKEGVYRSASPAQAGAYQNPSSPYRSYFRFNDGTQDFGEYEGWWGYDTLPKLNYEGSPALADEILRIGRKWVSAPYHCDGWRLDVAADLGHSSEVNHAFWKRFRAAVKDANPDSVVLAEHYGDPSLWLQGDEWDTLMNYDAFMEPVGWFLTGMEKHSDYFHEGLYGDGHAFFRMMTENMARLQRPSLDSAMNELSNHDHARFLTRTNRTAGRTGTLGPEAAGWGIEKGVFRAAVLIQMTWPGSPTIYYADEAGQVGWTDPDSRRTYPWGKEDRELIAFHQALTAFRGRCPCLRTGSVRPLYAGWHCIAYGRFDRDSAAVVLVNNSQQTQSLRLPVWTLGLDDDCLLAPYITCDGEGHRMGGDAVCAEDGYLTAALPAKTAQLYWYARPDDTISRK